MGLARKLVPLDLKGRRRAPLPFEDPRLLPPIIESLRESGQLRIYRPDKASDFASADPPDWYVHEEGVTATPVLVPARKALGEPEYMPEDLRVWVLDPVEPSREPAYEEDWLGAYVFIVEQLLDLKASRFVISGISALRFIAEKIAIDEDVRMDDLMGSEDVFGRWHEGHPIEKLKAVGGRAGRRRKIDTIYKIGYMSDEQYVEVDDGTEGRINDILAYPLYIAELLPDRRERMMETLVAHTVISWSPWVWQSVPRWLHDYYWSVSSVDNMGSELS